MNAVDLARRIKAPVRPYVRRHWNRPPFVTGARLAERYLRIWNNTSHEVWRSGEIDLLRRLTPFGFSTVVDVGCNVGAWADAALDALPTATVHAFEADPVLVDDLLRKFADQPRFVANRFGLSDEAGTATLRIVEGARDGSTMLDGFADRDTAEVPIRRGDEWAAEAGIAHIDLLKVDTEGFDWKVLTGFGDLLGVSTPVIQFEYTELNIVARRFLLDFYEMLEPLGYRLGKLHLNGVNFKDYDAADENWIGPVVLAVHESVPRVRAALAI